MISLSDSIARGLSVRLGVSEDEARRYINMPLDEQIKYIENRTGRKLRILAYSFIPSLGEGVAPDPAD